MLIEGIGINERISFFYSGYCWLEGLKGLSSLIRLNVSVVLLRGVRIVGVSVHIMFGAGVVLSNFMSLKTRK